MAGYHRFLGHVPDDFGKGKIILWKAGGIIDNTEINFLSVSFLVARLGWLTIIVMPVR